jgi:hypothetical protein
MTSITGELYAIFNDLEIMVQVMGKIEIHDFNKKKMKCLRLD